MVHQYNLLFLLTLAGHICQLIPNSLVTEPPIITLRGGNDLTEGTYIRSAWELIDQSGYLPIPTIPASNSRPIRLFVDVGLEIGSGLLCLLPSNPNLGFVLGMEAHPVNFGISYVNTLNMMKSADIMDNLTYKHSMVIPLGASNVDGMVEFYDSHSSACGSLLKSKVDAWDCAQTKEVRVIPVVRLATILSRIPPNYRFYYLKTDTEGADHLVLQGAGDYISQFEMVSIECRPSNDSHGDGSREGVCNRVNTIEYMNKRGFHHSSCDNFDCHFARLNEAQLRVAIKLHSIAGLSDVNGKTDCSKYHKAHIKLEPEWDNITALGVNIMSQKRKQYRKRLLSGDMEKGSAGSYDSLLMRRSLINSAKAYADSLIAHAMRITKKLHQHRRRFLSIQEIENKTATMESNRFPLVTDVPPLATYMTDNATRMTGKVSFNALSGIGGIKINFLWKISDPPPLDKRKNRFVDSLIVSIGSRLGSGLVCLLAENHHLVFLGLEPHPIRFALSHRNIFNNHFSHKNRVILLPVGAGNRSSMFMIKQSWTVGCEDSISAHWRLNTSLKRPQDCMTLPPVRIMLPVVRLDTLLTEKVYTSYGLHYLVISVDSGADGSSALPKPLEILHGVGKLLSNFEIISVDCPLLQTTDKDYPPLFSDCGLQKYFSTKKEDRESFYRQPYYSRLFWMKNYIINHGFSQWRCKNHACHFAKESSDIPLAIYYHRIKSLQNNKPIQVWSEEQNEKQSPEQRGKCSDDIYHEEIKIDLRQGLQKRVFHARTAFSTTSM